LPQSNSGGWWIARAQRVLSEEIPAPPDDVRAFYTDLHNIKTVHPLVVSVQGIERAETADGYRQTYQVKDRISLGPFTLPVSYVARLTVPSAGDVITEARQFPRVRLNGVVAFGPMGAGTRITERIMIEAAAVGRVHHARGREGPHRDAGGHAPSFRRLAVL
jgi:hypothetical protein